LSILLKNAAILRRVDLRIWRQLQKLELKRSFRPAAASFILSGGAELQRRAGNGAEPP
jgi:hypothetical protein